MRPPGGGGGAGLGHRAAAALLAAALAAAPPSPRAHPAFARCAAPAPAAGDGAGCGPGCSCEALADLQVHAGLQGAPAACAGEVMRLLEAGPPGRWAAFHVQVSDEGGPGGPTRCFAEQCAGGGCGRSAAAGQPPRACLAGPLAHLGAWATYAPAPLCPGGRGSPAALPEPAAPAPLWAAGAATAASAAAAASAEFVSLFGAQRLRGDQTLRNLTGECSLNVHRFVAKVCFREESGEQCDEWSKYSLPRCHVSLAMPYHAEHSDFLYAPACERTRQMLCPPAVPLALQVSLKAGSRSAVLWAAMLEGLLPAIVVARRTLATALAEGGDSGGGGRSRLGRFAAEWLEHEEYRLGCPDDAAFFSLSRAVHLLAQEAKIGLPLALCPTCCSTAAGRLRVVLVRSPMARLWSFYRGYWAPMKGHLLAGGFAAWVASILPAAAAAGLGPGGGAGRAGGAGGAPGEPAPAAVAPNGTLFEPQDLDHVAPALKNADFLTEGGTGKAFIFSLQDVVDSTRRLERRLCEPPFRHCAPLPPFPTHEDGDGAARTAPPTLPGHVAAEVASFFRFDLAALASARAAADAG